MPRIKRIIIDMWKPNRIIIFKYKNEYHFVSNLKRPTNPYNIIGVSELHFYFSELVENSNKKLRLPKET